MNKNNFVEMMQRFNMAKTNSTSVSKEDINAIVSNYSSKSICPNGHMMYTLKCDSITSTVVPIEHMGEWYILNLSFYENGGAISLHDVVKALTCIQIYC